MDGRGRPLAVRLTGGQAGDNSQLAPVLDAIAVPTGHRPRSRPDMVVAVKAYSHPLTRQVRRRKGIRVVIPERSRDAGAWTWHLQSGGTHVEASVTRRPRRVSTDAQERLSVSRHVFAATSRKL